MSKTKIREIKIFEDMMRVDISFLIGGTVPDLITFIKDRHKNAQMYSFDEKFDWTEDADTTDGYQFHVCGPHGKGEVFYVWVLEPTPYLLEHEISHLTGDILCNRGVKYCMECEEVFAYLGGWISDELSKRLKIRKVKT